MTPSRRADAAIKALRKLILTHYGIATTAGYGPRYLHSTGQLHKGGPESGLFLQLVEPMAPDIRIPGESYTFGTLARAQMIGDFQSLQSHSRPVVSIRLGTQGLARLRAVLSREVKQTARLHAAKGSRRSNSQ